MSAIRHEAASYKLFTALQTMYKKQQISLSGIGLDAHTILEYIEPCTTLNSLHKVLQEKTDNFFLSLDAHEPENPVIYGIKDFIHSNYSNDILSVKDVADYANFSTSYVCTFFKSETGKTINQYITDYRIQKAKELLMDPRNKITDISIKVGYSDSNYFGKSFKKSVGLSPSEFRERSSL